MDQVLLNIGFGSTVVSDRVVAIVSPNSAPMKRLKDEARKAGRPFGQDTSVPEEIKALKAELGQGNK